MNMGRWNTTKASRMLKLPHIYTNKAIWVRGTRQAGREASWAMVRKEHITHIVKDAHREGNLYDFYIHFNSGDVLLVDGLEAQVTVQDLWTWLNT